MTTVQPTEARRAPVPDATARVLVVRHQTVETDELVSGLRAAGYRVQAPQVSGGATWCVGGFRPHLLILDVALPDGGDGLALGAVLRGRTGAALLLLGPRSGVPDPLAAFDAGADDYLTAPFAVIELLARAAALLRRPGSAPRPDEPGPARAGPSRAPRATGGPDGGRPGWSRSHCRSHCRFHCRSHCRSRLGWQRRVRRASRTTATGTTTALGTAMTTPAAAGLALVVEDQDQVRQALAEALRDAGYTVAALPDGSGFEQTVDAFRPDLAILDVMLPGGRDGLVLGRALRARTDAALLFLTARDAVDDRLGGFIAGADTTSSSPTSPQSSWPGSERCCAGSAGSHPPSRSVIWCWTRPPASPAATAGPWT